ncbi:MAG: glutamate 5-kinase [Candidatus Omnitrophica bacterium]|jgi:glutamate 5-kinase|nr:glutamate 5-kinase [Candidatus Omnitrophota bacterium]
MKIEKMKEKSVKKVVVKIGSSVIAPAGKIDSSLIEQITKDVLKAESFGFKVILVSSGAIASGLNILGYKKRPQETHSLTAISSLGQIILMGIFNEKFQKQKRKCAQILLTWDDFDNRQRFMNIRKTIDKLLSINITPIINENDVVSYEEIRFGDNDCLSALVANLVGADLLIVLSDVPGLLKGDNLVEEVKDIDSDILSLARREDKVHTSGGMISKLKAVKIATASGIKTVITCGKEKEVISRILKGEKNGTLFLPSANKNQARKRWIAFSKKVKGTLFIDEGAKEALINKGRSLLAVGVTQAQGNFEKGDAVRVADAKGAVLGCGLINYSLQELQSLEKKAFKKEVIHRDNFVKGDKDLAWDNCPVIPDK